MKKGWEVKKLGEVCQIKPPKREAKEKLDDTDLVTFLPMEDLGILSKDVNAEKERLLKDVSGSYTYFAEDDVLLAKITPCFENGKLGIARNLINGIGFGSSEYIVLRTRGEVLPEYLFYFLSSESFRDEGRKVMTGAVGHKRVPKEFIDNYPIPYPKSTSEQQQIVYILDEAFAAIDQAKENVQRNLQNAKELFQSELNSIFANKGEGWEKQKLGSLGTITSSKRIYKSEYVSDGIPFYRTKEIKELSNGRDISLELFISKKRYLEIRETFGVPQIGDILMSAVGTIGEILVIENDSEFYFKDGNIVWFKEYNNVNPYYLKYALTAFVEAIKQLSIGSAYSALTIEKLKEYEVYVPSSKEQEEIVNQLDMLASEARKLEEQYQQKLNLLEELKKSILQKAFSCKLAAVKELVA